MAFSNAIKSILYRAINSNLALLAFKIPYASSERTLVHYNIIEQHTKHMYLYKPFKIYFRNTAR